MQGDYKDFEPMSEDDDRKGWKLFINGVYVGRFPCMSHAAIIGTDFSKGVRNPNVLIQEEETGKVISMAKTDGHGSKILLPC